METTASHYFLIQSLTFLGVSVLILILASMISRWWLAVPMWAIQVSGEIALTLFWILVGALGFSVVVGAERWWFVGVDSVCAVFFASSAIRSYLRREYLYFGDARPWITR